MTFYLKYRPQKIEEIDLANVRESLQNLAKNPEIPHAFLFAGPRGAGKTSSARILAKIVNCERVSLRTTDYGLQPESKKSSRQSTVDGRQTPEPCNKCDQCVAITKGTSLNVIEIDAASHRGVDDIRALRETVKLSPAGGRMKVYIIDEAHMLTTEAANALLKTLEEPPSHAIFVLATTAPEKLPDTVRSRSTTFVFRRGKRDEIIRSLERAVKGEGIKIEKDALYEIAKNVDGSFREAHKILEQLALSNEKITQEAVKTLFELAAANPQKLLSYLAKKDVKRCLEEIERVVEKGANLKLYTSEIIRILRLLLLSKIGVLEDDAGLEAGLEIEEIDKFVSGEIKTLIELFSEAARQLPTAIIPQLSLELAAVKWGEWETKNEKLQMKSEKGSVEVVLQATKEEKSNTRGHAPVPRKEGKELEDSWREIMRQVKSKNHSAEALLRAARPKGFDGKVLEIDVFYQFHKERIEKEPYRAIVEGAASIILGGDVRLLCRLSSSKEKAIDLVNVTEVSEEDITKIAEEIFKDKGNSVN